MLNWKSVWKAFRYIFSFKKYFLGCCNLKIQFLLYLHTVAQAMQYNFFLSISTFQTIITSEKVLIWSVSFFLDWLKSLDTLMTKCFEKKIRLFISVCSITDPGDNHLHTIDQKEKKIYANSRFPLFHPTNTFIRFLLRRSLIFISLQKSIFPGGENMYPIKIWLNKK